MARKKTSSPPSRHNDTEEVIDLDNPEFQRAWELLQYTSQSVFLTGKAGTGKSTFLRYITRHTHKPYVVLTRFSEYRSSLSRPKTPTLTANAWPNA